MKNHNESFSFPSSNNTNQKKWTTNDRSIPWSYMYTPHAQVRPSELYKEWEKAQNKLKFLKIKINSQREVGTEFISIVQFCKP